MDEFDSQELTALKTNKATAEKTSEWVSITDLPSSTLFGDSVGVTQGILDDCWVIAALVTIDRTRPHLRRTIVTHNTDGTCTVTIWKAGTKHEIVVTDRILCCTDGEAPVPYYVKAPNAWWIALAEKGYAALYGSYAALKGGLEADALMDFSGSPAAVAELSKATLLEAWSAGDMVGLSHFGDVQDDVKAEDEICATVTLAETGGKAELRFRVNDDPVVIATAFCLKHSLDDAKIVPLTGFIKQHQNGAADHIARSATSDAHTSRPERADIIKSHSYALLSMEGERCHIWNAWGAGALKGAETREGDMKGSFWVSIDEVLKLFNALHRCVECVLMGQGKVQVGGIVSMSVPEDTAAVYCCVAAETLRGSQEAAGSTAVLGFSIRCGSQDKASVLCPVRQLCLRAGPLPTGEYPVHLTHGKPDTDHTVLLYKRVRGRL